MWLPCFIIHSLTAQQGAEWGLRNRRVGGWGNKQWGKHSIRPAIVVFLQRGAGAKKILFVIFFAEPIFGKGTKPKINIFLRLFLRQNNTLDRELIISANRDWHGNYTGNCQREDGPEALVVTTYPIYLIPHEDGPLSLVAPGPGPALEGAKGGRMVCTCHWLTTRHVYCR